MSRIFWDTNLFVYLLEGQSDSTERVADLRQRMLEREDVLLTSALTLGEVLVKPLESGNGALARRYEELITTGATIVPFDLSVAPRFAAIRQDRSIRAPDAIQLACASSAKTDLFITNDDRLSRKNVEGIQFIQALDVAAL